MKTILPRRLRVHPCLGRRNLLVFLCLYQRKQPPNLPVCDQSASAPMNRNTLGLIVVGSGILFVVGQELLLSPVTPKRVCEHWNAIWLQFTEPLPCLWRNAIGSRDQNCSVAIRVILPYEELYLWAPLVH